MSKIVEVKNVCKRIKEEDILKNINLEIEEGEIYGFLGANGAGKTTLMKCILSLSSISSGEIKVFGKDLYSKREEILSQIGSIIETPIFYDNWTARQILESQGKYMGYSFADVDIDETLNSVGLRSNKKKVKEFSLGMRQRLAIACAIFTKPKLLILDEPINGLDPSGVKEVRDLLLRLSKEESTTVLISSHILAEISQIADKIGVIKEGHMIQEVSMEKLKEENIDLEEYFLSISQESSESTMRYIV